MVDVVGMEQIVGVMTEAEGDCKSVEHLGVLKAEGSTETAVEQLTDAGTRSRAVEVTVALAGSGTGVEL